MPTFPEQVDNFLSEFKKKPEMGAVLEQLSEKKLFKPGVEEYFQAMQKAGVSYKKIVDTIYSDRKNYLIDKYPEATQPTAAQQKQTQQTEQSQTAGTALQSLFNQQLPPMMNQQQMPTMAQPQIPMQGSGNLPLSPQGGMPSIQPSFLGAQGAAQLPESQFMTKPRQGAMDLLMAGIPISEIKKLQGIDPSLSTPEPPKPLTPSEKMTQEKLRVVKGTKDPTEKKHLLFPSSRPKAPKTTPTWVAKAPIDIQAK